LSRRYHDLTGEMTAAGMNAGGRFVFNHRLARRLQACVRGALERSSRKGMISSSIRRSLHNIDRDNAALILHWRKH
jgi:hypothetical protein